MAVGVLAGCGGAPEPLPTVEVAPGSTVTPARYLGLVREAVAAARAAAIRLDALPVAPTAPQARRAAPGLAAAALRSEAAARQISAARLEDQRLEGQRTTIGPLYVALAADLRAASRAAAAGDVRAMREAVAQAAVQAGRIHEAAAPGGDAS
jgi:hypothetical protein